MKITIVINYQNAESMTPIWAEAEDIIDFRSDSFSAERCTAAFAACELKQYLVRTIIESHICFTSSRSGSEFIIELQNRNKYDENGFTIEPVSNGVLICGNSRKGLLYGVYEFLRLQGWRWYAPGKAGEIAPLPVQALNLPEFKTSYEPAMKLGRGFDFEAPSMESRELFLWMARNRLDMVSYRPLTGNFCKKLGMSFKNGGHIFEDILDPDRVMPSGKTLWEEHEAWFGLPANGLRKKDSALYTQFCVSQKDLVEFLGEELLKCLRGKWKEADRIDVWGFDTWGSVCNCEECRKLGNGSDMMLFFLSEMRRIIDSALANKRLDHNVRLVMCIYEGTSTIVGPVNPVPQNLIEAGDYGVFYPIKRCYAHDFQDHSCSYNKHYSKALKSWFAHKPSLPVMIGEYYNVSKFEDLPLLFTKRISNDIPFYFSTGVNGMTYMHIPMVNWGMRTLTQLLYAQLIWDANTDIEMFLNEYFANWYGPEAENAKRAYKLIEEAWLSSAGWRAWGDQSILTQLQKWTGRKPEKPLQVDDHFKTPEGAVKIGQRSVRLMSEALEIIKEMLGNTRIKAKTSDSGLIPAAVNPIEQRNNEMHSLCESRISEDRRLLLYGIDTMKIMTYLAEYHNALYSGDENNCVKLWRHIEKTADRMDSYFAPIGFEWPGPGLESKDALTRSQVRELVARIRSCRA